MSSLYNLSFLAIKILFVIIFVTITLTLITDVNNQLKEDELNELDENSYSKAPFIFVGGFPYSEADLAAKLLDAHADVRCGKETLILADLLDWLNYHFLSAGQWVRLKEAGVTEEIINNATIKFVYKIIKGHVPPANRLCNLDPYLLNSTKWLSSLFPASKFVLLVRDGRAVADSMITSDTPDLLFDENEEVKDWRTVLTYWNTVVKSMWTQCHEVGYDKCIVVHYEKLLLRPKEQLSRILTFLGLPFNDNTVYELINAAMPEDEKIKRLKSLKSWVADYPFHIKNNISNIAHMLEILDYDVVSDLPEYFTPEIEIAHLINKINKKK